MASGVIKRPADFKFVMMPMGYTITLQPNEVKYYDCPRPNDNNYNWILYAILTGTWAVGVNDYDNSGVRFRNNNSNNSVEADKVKFYWMGVRS